jgi:hypothetical protein
MSKLDDIRKIFEGYGKKLLEQKKQMIEKIHVWRNKCFRAIDEHVAEEKKHLDEEYERQKDLLEQQRQQFTKEASYQERKRDEEHIRHLVDQCMDLKFQLAAFKNIKREVMFIQLMAEDQQTQTNQNKRSANEISEFFCSQQSLTMKSSHGELAEECPTCYMVFSPNMELRDRTAHVNGHFTNE